MSVKYKVVERRQPGNPKSPRKYYPSIRSSGRVNQREIVRMISCRKATPFERSIYDEQF